MSILIKGMAIPKNCGECPCYYDGYCQGIPYNEDDEDFREVSYKEYDKKRRDDCPLIELPPHGRLIDADALHIDLIDRGIADIQMNDWYEIQQAVDDAPTIIEADSMQRNDSNALGALESEEEDG